MQHITGFYGLEFRDRTFIAAPPSAGFAYFNAMAANYRGWHPDHIRFEWLSASFRQVGTG